MLALPPVAYAPGSPSSLPDAKPAENPVEQVIGVDGSDHFAELVERAAHLQGQ